MKSPIIPALAAIALLTTNDLMAVDYTNAGGDQYWGNTANWDGALPDAVGAEARMINANDNSVIANRTLLLADSSGNDASFTVRKFTIGSKSAFNNNPVYRLDNVSDGTGNLIFDSVSGDAVLWFENLFQNVTMEVNTDITLNDNLKIIVERSTSGTYQINGKISSGIAGTGIILSQPTPSTAGGTLQVGGANDYTGATTINSGTLQLITGDDRLTTTTALAVNGGATAAAAGTLDLNTRNQKVGSLSGGGGVVQGVVTNSGGGTGVATLTVESTTTNSTFDGVIQDGATAKVALTKAGAGTSLTLTGAHTYTGETTVDGGSLFVNGSLASGSVVTVNAGGTLGGSGIISGVVTVQSGGFLAPGNSPGILTVGSLVLNSGSTTSLEIGGTVRGASFDGIDVTTASGLTYGGALNLVFSSTLTNGDSLDLFNFTGTAGGSLTSVASTGSYAGTWTAGVGVWTFVGNDQLLTFDLATGDLSVVASAIPEPSTYAALFGGVALLFAGVRRKRRMDS